MSELTNITEIPVIVSLWFRCFRDVQAKQKRKLTEAPEILAVNLKRLAIRHGQGLFAYMVP